MGAVAVTWALLGLTLILGTAIFRLTPIAIGAIGMDLNGLHWLLLIANLAFMLYSEGYRGFQKSFSPRVAARIRHLRDHPTPIRTVLAPLFCMGFFATTRRRLIGTYALTAMIVILIILVHQLEQPWRGALDVGVVAGLAWGLLSTLLLTARALTNREFDASPELSEPERGARTTLVP